MGKINILMLFSIIAINCVPLSKLTTAEQLDPEDRQTHFPHNIIYWGSGVGQLGIRGSVRGCQFLNLGLLEARTHRSARG